MARILSLVVALSLTAPSLAAAEDDPAEAPAPAERDPAVVQREVERVLGRSHQRELPGFDPAVGESVDERRVRRERDRMATRRGDRRIDPRTGRPRDPGDRARGPDDRAPAGPLSGLATFLLWGLVVAAAIVIAFAVYAQVTTHVGDDKPDAPRKVDDAQLAAVIERPRDDADELASAGRFADAIHILLLRTLHELASQHLVRVTASMTSREILARVSLLGDAREALAGLIVAVEQTWFGDDVPQLADYQRCRVQFDRFAAAYRRGAGARA